MSFLVIHYFELPLIEDFADRVAQIRAMEAGQAASRQRIERPLPVHAASCV
jgi:hypothetical protein